MVDLYIEKYGEPTNTIENWKNDLYKDDSSDWGFAISRGDVVFSSYWEDESGASIMSGITGDNYEITTFFNYRSPYYQDEQDMSGI